MKAEMFYTRRFTNPSHELLIADKWASIVFFLTTMLIQAFRE
jgi:hypothetical protein